ncbi:transposase-like protein [Agrobacterium larrymoorei]|uniref:Transposase-like protein n=1 Tax=Agrobacterium larrymoorei TaxID=160699 RepID=A0AAJ2EQD4_9HYPH|nr:transposase-like protein [Agrobacterium larrymoorei]
MKCNRFPDERIIGILKEREAGTPVSELCRKHGVSDASIYKWKAKFGGMDVSEANRLKTLEDENTKLKRLLADAMLDTAALKDPLGKNVWSASSVQGYADIVNDDSSCINVSGLSRVSCGCSQAMMRSAHAVPNKWFGHEARFFAQDLRHVDPLFRHHYSRALQSSQERQVKAGSLRS